LLEQLVRPNLRARALAPRPVDGRFWRWHVQKAAELFVIGQQGFDALAQRCVARAGFVEKAGPLGGIALG
jgi:hypothetical protein